MSLLVLASAKASPGVTTAALALAATWPAERRVRVVEADADGGALAARLQLPTEPGLATLAVSSRRSLASSDVVGHLQQPAGSDVEVLVAPPSAEQARRALALVADPLAQVLADAPDSDTVVDVGRLRPDPVVQPLLRAADAVLFVCRPRVEEVQHLPARLRALSPTLARVGLLLVGDRPYPPAEVADALDTEVVSVLADDRRAADALVSGDVRHLRRSSLLRSVRDAGESIRSWVAAAAPVCAQPVDGEAPMPPSPPGAITVEAQ